MKNHSNFARVAYLVSLVSLLGASLLTACGGGSANTTAPAAETSADKKEVPGAPTLSGTVTGFGSLIVDGTRLNNHGIPAHAEKEGGKLEEIELKLGHHVEVQHDGNLSATKIRVRSSVEGVVQAIDVVAGTLKVLGQTISVNANATLGPVTVYESPYTQLSDVKLNDNVEVHALVKLDAAGKISLQATRIQKRVPEAHDRIHGMVSALSTTAHTFKLGDLLIDYTDAKLLPEKAVLANGVEVQVSLIASTGTVVVGAAIKAKEVTIIGRKAENEGKQAELGGAISVLDVAGKKITLNGIVVDLSAATFNQPGKSIADLKVGTYLVVKGTYTSNTTLKASTVVIRGVDEDKDKHIELHGSILDFKSIADFTVRGVAVDASAAVVDPVSCKGIVLANNIQVEIFGSLSATGKVKAITLKCEKQKDAETVIGRHGVASKVDATAMSFTLTAEKEVLNVKWSASTLFVRVAANTLEGKTVTAEGTVVAGVMQAEKIILAQK